MKIAIKGALLVPLLLGGCDNIFSPDNYEPPEALLKGQLVYQGNPIGVRSNALQMQLWQPGPEFQLNTSIPVHIDQNGSFSAKIFEGDYELNLIAGGPWVDNTTRIPVKITGGTTTIQVPVTPYYTIENAQVTHNKSVNAPVGAIQATFNIGRINTTRALEFVGLYVWNTAIVDRVNSITVANTVRERTLTQLGGAANLGNPVTITVNLPSDIYVTPSPAPREEVFVRVGVKTAGVAEMLFTPVIKVPI